MSRAPVAGWARNEAARRRGARGVRWKWFRPTGFPTYFPGLEAYSTGAGRVEIGVDHGFVNVIDNWGLSSLSPKSTSERQPMYQLALWGSPRVLKGQRGRRADSFPVLGHWPFEFIQVRVVGITQASNHRGETNRPGTTGESGAMRRALSHENVPTHRQQNPSQGQPEVGKRGNTSRGRGGRGGDGTGGELPQLRRRGATAV